jgi:hypothetical protein
MEDVKSCFICGEEDEHLCQVLTVPIGERPCSSSYPQELICSNCRLCDLCMMGDIVQEDERGSYVWKCASCTASVCSNNSKIYGKGCETIAFQGQCIGCVKESLCVITESFLLHVLPADLVSICMEYYEYQFYSNSLSNSS